MSDLSSLFIEVGCLKNKLNQIRYELGCVVIPKNSKKIGFILIRRFPGRASNLCQSALGMCRSAFQECRLALLDAEPLFQFWFDLDSFLRIFESGIAARHIFLIHILKLIPFILIIRS